MKSTNRRDFIGGGAALLAALGWNGCLTLPDGDERLSAWKPGALDLHFIYTGCGENIFYRLPDGTAILNDTGEYYRPKDIAEVPLLPNSSRLGGDWVARYLKRVYPEDTIDYAIFSHWHTDHIGHVDFGVSDTPQAAFRYRVTPDGRKIDGFLCVAEEFRFRRCLDHQYPNRVMSGDTQSCLRLIEEWTAREKKHGVVVEPFEVGALDQIRMQRDEARYRGQFSIRNITANGVVWDGKTGAIDLAGEHRAATGEKSLSENTLSLSFLMRYGNFSYYASGDIQTQKFRRKDGTTVDYESEIGSLLGPLTLCKMGHHGCRNAMDDGFVRNVRADAYVGCMWCPLQSHPETMSRLTKYRSYSGRQPLILPQLMSPMQREWFAKKGCEPPHSGAVHVVVRVAPGGGSYGVYLIDAHDEEMRVVAKFERAC